MKRFISIFFTLCLVVALSLSASAESTNKLTYAVGASAPTVSANTDITIMVEVTENTGICWLKAVVTYDSSVLSYVGYTTDTSVFKSDLITVNSSVNGNEGKIIIVVGSMEVIYQDNPTIYKNVGKLVDRHVPLLAKLQYSIGNGFLGAHVSSSFAICRKTILPKFVTNRVGYIAILQKMCYNCDIS